MVNPWRKYIAASKRQKQALHSLFAGLAFFSVLYLVTRVFGVTLCPIQRFFGVSCFGCGLTRGFIAILRLDLVAAVRHHVLSIPIFLGITAYAILCFTDILFERNDLGYLSKLCSRRYRLVLYFIILVLSAVANKTIRGL